MATTYVVDDAENYIVDDLENPVIFAEQQEREHCLTREIYQDREFESGRETISNRELV